MFWEIFSCKDYIRFPARRGLSPYEFSGQKQEEGKDTYAVGKKLDCVEHALRLLGEQTVRAH